jgi:hypothetical protein
MGRQTASSRKPNEFIRKAAQAYNERYGFGEISEGLYVAVDINRARRIADPCSTSVLRTALITQAQDQQRAGTLLEMSEIDAI